MHLSAVAVFATRSARVYTALGLGFHGKTAAAVQGCAEAPPSPHRYHQPPLPLDRLEQAPLRVLVLSGGAHEPSLICASLFDREPLALTQFDALFSIVHGAIHLGASSDGSHVSYDRNSSSFDSIVIEFIIHNNYNKNTRTCFAIKNAYIHEFREI